jgi:dipeptidyl aminopeptidase/acylaminoacyl peptidase
MKRSLFLFVLLSAVGLPAAEAQSVRLEDLLSSPFPADLAAEGDAFAWTQNDRGLRSVWFAEGPEYRGRALFQDDRDEGQELSELRFGPGGRQLVFVRGGSANRSGEIPNPTSDAEGASQAIWIVPTEGSGKARKVGAGAEPRISPDGKTLAFVSQGRIWTVPVEGEGEAKELAVTRGRAGSLRWSPDGRELAFVSDRGDHSFIGLYSFGGKTVRYLDPGLGLDAEPVWSPDGRRIAFLRTPNERQVLPFIPQRSALPWSIRIADVETGTGRQVFLAEEGRGSAFHGIAAENQILWGKPPARGASGDPDRLVFPWEKTGWTQLYSIPATGGEPTALTSGEFEVEQVALSPDGSEVVFSSNQGDIDRRHIFRVSVSSGPARAITSGTGLEWSPVASEGARAIAFLSSDARRPAQAMVKIGDAAPKAMAPETLPSRFPVNALVEPEPVLISASDGMRVHGQLFRPKSHRPGERHKAAIFFHGGSRRQMLLGWHYMYYYHNSYAMNQYLASRGYVVLSVNYRSGIGYGLDFREALDYGANGASEFRDVVGAGLYLRSRDDVDPDRVALWGGSYGGYLTALGLARASDLFAAGVDLHGVHDWNVVIQNFVPQYQSEKRSDVARMAYESSPMASVSSWRSPVLLIHGDDDRNVPFSESVDLAEALSKQGVEYEVLVFPDDVHDFLLHRNWLKALEASAEFLDRKLGSAAPTTNQN